MSSFQSTVNALIARASQTTDPLQLDILQKIINELNRISIIVEPPPIVSTRTPGNSSAIPLPVTDISYTLTSRNVILNWSAPTNDFIYYELRKGSEWNTATFILTTAERQVILDPLTIGTHTYLIKSLNGSGTYSTTTGSVDVIIPELGPITITSDTIDQNVLLYWNAPTSTFIISHYVITKDGNNIGTTSSTFAALVELTNGTYEFGVTAVDIAGNESEESLLSVIVTGPPDFILRDSFISDLSGTKTNAVIEENYLLLPVNTTETWDDHFTNNSWATPQAQVDAGYPLYIQPGFIDAEYEETFDVGLIYPSTIISISYNTEILIGSFNIEVSTRVSDDGISWSSPQTGLNIFVESVRYIEVTVIFEGNDDKALLKFFNFQVSLNVKESIDSGAVDAIDSDPDGTVVEFNLEFKDIDSITLTVEEETGPYTAVYAFDDIPNPTEFAVFVFDETGARASKTVSWKARGII